MTVEESAERIYGLLREALSDQGERRRAAEIALRDAENGIDYFASLAMITVASDEDAEIHVRWLAALCGKNAVWRSWRRNVRKNGVTEDERSFVRDTLLSAIGEKHSTIATQISVWIANIARSDFPTYWPSLINDLCDFVREQDQAVMLHALVTLDMVLKQLASRRLASDRNSLYQVAPKIFAILHDHFISHLQNLVANQAVPQMLQTSFCVVERCLKSFRRLLEYGCRTIDNLPLVSSVFAKLLQLSDVFMRGAAGGTEMQIRLSHLAAKLIRSTQEHHPIGFQPFLSAFMELYYQTIVSFDFAVSADRVCYQAALFIHNILSSISYDISYANIIRFNKDKRLNASPPHSVSAEGCRHVVLSFFDENRVNSLIEAMISKIFILSEKELETWASDPEALVREEEAADWGTESLRHECEEIFKILLLRDKSRIVPMILRLTESVPRDKPLLLDACYRAVGRAVYDVQGAFDFEVWLSGRLKNILCADCSSDLGERIIQARTAWLVGQFVEQLTRDSRIVVTPLLVRLMNVTDGDRVIALTAAKALQMLVDDMGFHSGDFAPHLEKCVIASFRLVFAVDTAATKRDLMGIVASIIERSRPQFVIPIIDLIATSLPELWRHEYGSSPIMNNHSAIENYDTSPQNGMNPGDENLLRTSIVTLLTTVCRKTGPAALQSVAMRKTVFEIIDFAVDLGKGRGGHFMMEEGCELWTVVASSSEEYSQELVVLFPRTMAILGVDFDNLKEVFRLMEEYALVGKEQFMNQYGGQMLQTLEKVLDAVKERGCLAAIEIMDLLLQLFPKEGVRFIGRVLRICLEKVLSRQEGQVLASAYVALLARACMVNIADVESLVLEANELTAVQLVDSLIGCVDSVYRLQRRKLVVLAVCGLTKRYSASTEVQQRVPAVLNAVVQVLAEERTRRPMPRNQDFNNFLARFGEEGKLERSEEDAAPEELPGTRRRRALADSDILRHVNLQDACADLLTGLRAIGEERYNAIIGLTDERVLRQLESLAQK